MRVCCVISIGTYIISAYINCRYREDKNGIDNIKNKSLMNTTN